ncbi:M48 family metallopeptidase [Sulfurovum sp. bin170]|uniref:M48 family metallopeptidase n=1 Tax=Sulfurovum sp. bin170 TaxID=2695268 RepID=UPI0013E0816C|nr:M48 family metallopeptidase [Sulfurovum sp. bin170]NEW60268.1 M48 family metallopeptidase [Sulfurovum sp. bin170]
MLIEAVLYDGKSSKEHSVTIEFTFGRRVKIDSHGIDVALDDIEVESRLGNTPRVLEFPDGVRCKSRENDKIDQILLDFNIEKSKTHKIESSWGLTLGSVLVTVGFVWFMLTTGASYTAHIVASVLPQSTLDEVSVMAMNELEDEYLSPTKLSDKNRMIIQAHFDSLTKEDSRYSLHFRSSIKMGANAFALPSGDIVLTDQLVALSRDDEFRDILGVLAHEKGHVVEKHSLRMAIKTALSGAIIGYMTGDISILVTAVPTVLISSGYSRDFEREADAHAVKELQKLDVSTIYMANLFEELAKEHGMDENSSMVGLITSHPLTQERIEYFKSFNK